MGRDQFIEASLDAFGTIGIAFTCDDRHTLESNDGLFFGVAWPRSSYPVTRDRIDSTFAYLDGSRANYRFLVTDVSGATHVPTELSGQPLVSCLIRRGCHTPDDAFSHVVLSRGQLTVLPPLSRRASPPPWAGRSEAAGVWPVPGPPTFTATEVSLLCRNYWFYLQLKSGRRVPTTAAQVRFARAVCGCVEPLTPDEIAFTKYIRWYKDNHPEPRLGPEAWHSFPTDFDWK